MKENSRNDLGIRYDEKDSYQFPRRPSYPVTIEIESLNDCSANHKNAKSTEASSNISRLFSSKNKVTKERREPEFPSFLIKRNSFFEEKNILKSKIQKGNSYEDSQKPLRSPVALLEILYKIHSVALFGNDRVEQIGNRELRNGPLDSSSIESENSLIESENIKPSHNARHKLKSNQVSNFDTPKRIKLSSRFTNPYFNKKWLNSPNSLSAKLKVTSNNSGAFSPIHQGTKNSWNRASSFTDASIINLGISSNSWEYGDLECWMTNLPHKLQMVPIHHLLLPGSHDSFSYSLDGGQIGPDSPPILSQLVACCPCIVSSAILRWVVTQRTSVTEQLLHGIRYFDIRVAGKGERFYFVHGLYGSDLEPLLEEIQIFLNSRPGEVVILDFQHFYGFTDELHESLIELLSNIFSGLKCPTYDSLNHLNLAFLSKQRFQVLIFYRHSSAGIKSGFWPAELLPNPWPKATNPSDLLKFVEENLARRSLQHFYVTQCVLTPTSRYLAFNFLGSLKKTLADPCNKATISWISSLEKGNRSPNIIMTDFVDADDWAIPKAIIRQNVSDL